MKPKRLSRLLWCRAIVTVLCVLCSLRENSTALRADELATTSKVWIYRNEPKSDRDDRSATERAFSPYGIMPRERSTQVAVQTAHPRDPKNPKTGTCVEVTLRFLTPTDWQGTYWLKSGGTAWGSEPGIDVQKLLRLKPDDKVALRFHAWGSGSVTFKCGGVNDGRFPSSLKLPISAPESPRRLDATPREFTIGPIPARMLTNIIDPLCVVASGLDQRGAQDATIYIDDIRFELFDRRARAAVSVDWRQKISETLWVSYTPTGFDPSSSPVKRPTPDNIRADLQALRRLQRDAGLADGSMGIVTYGVDNGLESIPSIAHELGFIQQLGIFSPKNEIEVANAKRLLEDDSLSSTIVSVIVGNESLTFRRGDLDDIERVIRELKAVRDIPCTSTEIIQEMGNERLRAACDYLSVNSHAVFSNIYDPDKAVTWVENQITALQHLSGNTPVLIKEVGWPDGPNPFSPSGQRTYWTKLLGSPHLKQTNIGIFDAICNTPWKHESISVPGGGRVDVGNDWAVLLNEQREPLPFALELLKLWKQSRQE